MASFYFLPIHYTARLAQILRQRTIGFFLKLNLIVIGRAEVLAIDHVWTGASKISFRFLKPPRTAAAGGTCLLSPGPCG